MKFTSMKKFFAIAAVAAVGAGGIAPAVAGSATAQSQWNRGQAVERAKEHVPAGATVTGTQCSERLMDDNNLWTCKVTWN
tara:strand:+ start:188 stop:427 length:240 start_codon:yes stop_codon:yes gene_type:complete